MRSPAVLAQCRDLVGQFRRPRGDHPAIAEGAQILRRIQAERGDFRERADLAVAQSGPVRLAAILDHRRAMPRGGGHDRCDINGLAVEMHGNDGPDRRQARRGMIEQFGKFGGVHGVVRRVDVDQHGRRADHFDRGHRGDRGVRDGGNRAARPDAETAQRKRQRVGAVGAADRAGAAHPRRILGLERPPFGAEDVPAGGQGTRHRRVDLGLQGAVAGAGVGLRNKRYVHHALTDTPPAATDTSPPSGECPPPGRFSAPSRRRPGTRGHRRDSCRCRWLCGRRGIRG